MAGWKVTTAASEAVISTSEAKAWLRVEHSEDDAIIAMLVASATQTAQNYLSQAFVTQTITETFDTWDSEMKLTIHPVQAVTGITYIDSDGVSQTLSSTIYNVDTYAKRAILTQAYNQTYPSLQTQRNAITVVYTAGYGLATSVPADIKQALLLMIADAYENRQDSVKQLPSASKYILDRINYAFLL